MYKVKFYLLHGWYRDSSGRYTQDMLAVDKLDDNAIKTFSALGYGHFKVDYIEVVYDYSESEGDSND